MYRGSGGNKNLNKLMKQAKKMQAEMGKVQEALAHKTLEITAGGGMVKVVINGHKVIQELQINPEVVDPDDIEMLQDLVLAAVNEAVEKAEKMAQDAMSKVTGGMPGLF